MTEIVSGFQEPDDLSKGLRWIQKDPSAEKDYERDWAVSGDSFLDTANGETLDTVTWVIHDNDWNILYTWNDPNWDPTGSPPAGSLIGSTGPHIPSNTTTTAKVWLKLGVDGEKYLVTCRVTTSAGRKDDKSFQVRMVQQ